MNSSKANTFRSPSLFRTTAGDPGKVYAVDRWLARAFLRGIGATAIGAELWDGEDAAGGGKRAQKMVIRDRLTLWRLVTNPLLNFGDDYSAGAIEVEGGLVPFLETVFQAMKRQGTARRPLRLAGARMWQGLNSISRARRNIQHHYDIGNDFYRLWLDEEMVYTCAYYTRPELPLEDAQAAKMDLICRKLRLKEGDRVIEAGCGWGGLARHMAKRYGARVRAFNISHEQIEFARARAKAESLFNVEYIEDDYRNITGQCDAFVSVGMLEHVGTGNYGDLGEVIDRTLSDTGLGLIHTIGQNAPESVSEWLEKRIFPGGYPPSVKEMCAVFEPYGFSMLDLENLRLHYARTLEHWLERFEAHTPQITRMFDENFVRAWRLYLCGSIANFTIGRLQLFQVLFARGGNNGIPWTRAGVVAEQSHGKM